MRPLLYFSYGMTKSGSTLGFELARTALELSGCPQPRLSLAAVENRKNINFCGHIDAARAGALRSEIAQIGSTVALKTHTRPDPIVVEMLEQGEAFAHAIFRDPRDMALSMVDHGARNRAAGRASGFTEYRRVEDTIDDLRHQSNSLLAWLSLPGVRPLLYDHLAFETGAATTRIVQELGTEIAARDVIAAVEKDRFTQKSKAVRDRHTNEMDPATSALFQQIFAPMFDRLINAYPNLPRDGSPVLDHRKPLCNWDISVNSTTGQDQ